MEEESPYDSDIGVEINLYTEALEDLEEKLKNLKQENSSDPQTKDRRNLATTAGESISYLATDLFAGKGVQLPVPVHHQGNQQSSRKAISEKADAASRVEKVPVDQFAMYKKLPGTRDVGREFEQVMCGLYALQLAIRDEISDFQMTSNNLADGKFDDLGLRITSANGSAQRFLFQLKHKERKKITVNDLKSENEKSDFSIKKYVESIANMDVKEDTIFILSTNCSTYIQGAAQLTDDLSVEECGEFELADLFVNIEEGHERKILKIKSEKLRHKFYFLSAQMSVKKTEEKTIGILESLLQCEIHGAFASYMRNWWSGQFILTKPDVIAKISELALTPFLKTLTDRKCNEKTDSLRQAIMSFPLTIAGGCEEGIVENIWTTEEAWIDEKFSKAKNKYGLKEHQKSTILWYLGKLPLIVNIDRFNEEIIRSVMSFLRTDMGDKKIVLCGDVTRHDFQLPNNLESLWDIIEQCEEKEFCSDIMRTFHVSLQGRGSIALESLVRTDADLAKLIRTKELLRMSQQAFLPVGNGKEELPDFYIPRTVSPVAVKTEDILKLYQSSQDTQLIFNCDENFEKKISENRDISTMDMLRYTSMENDEKPENVVLLSTRGKCTNLQFEEICKRSEKLNVYLFQYLDDGDFMLTLRKGKRLVLETSCKTKTIKEIEFFEHFKNPLQVCCAPPGMGKSTLLKVLYNNCPSDSLAVLVNLINYNEFLAQQPDFQTIVSRFLGIDGKENDLFQQLKRHFWQKQKLYMLLDGLDEVNSQYVQHIIDFVWHASSQGGNVCVSSRENLRDVVCETLNAVPIEINELDEAEQEGYIRSKLEPSYKEEEIEEITMAVFNNADLSSSQNLLGIPLQLHIITEMFLQDRGVYERLEEKYLFVLTHMYKIFFEGKIKFAWGKLVANNSLEQQLVYPKYILQFYELPALKASLDNYDYENLNLDEDADLRGTDFWQNLRNEGDKCGIIKSVNADDEAVFNHQTYAEYFACVWYKKNPSKIALLKYRIFTEKYENLRLMFDVVLAEKNPLHLAIIYKDVERVERHIEEISCTDEGGRTVFHLAFSYGQKYKEFSETKRETPSYVKIIEKLFEQGELVEDKDALFGFDCVDYALQSDCLFPIEKMLEKGWLTFSRVEESFDSKYSKRVLIDFVATCGYPNLAFTLIREYEIVQQYVSNGHVLELAVQGCSGDDCATPRQGNVEIVKRLIMGNYGFRFDRMCRILDKACNFKYFDMLELLIKNHARCSLHTIDLLTCCYGTPYFGKIMDAINAGNAYGVTPLHLAAADANPKIVTALLKSGASSRILNKEGTSALHYASGNSRRGVLEMLLRNGAAVNAENRNGVTPLHLACSNGMPANVRTLLKQGADPGIGDNNKNNALHYALRSSVSSKHTILLLIKAGVSVNAQNKNGMTAFHLASKNGVPEIVEMFLKQGGDPHVTDNDGDNALHYALKASVATEHTIQLLIEAGISVNAQNKDGMTALHFASKNGVFGIVRMLLKQGADPNMEDNDKNNALHYSLTLYAYNPDIVLAMIRHGLNPNARSKNGKTLLHIACLECDVRTIQELVEKGFDVNTLDYTKQAPLHAVFQFLNLIPPRRSYVTACTFNMRTHPTNGRRDVNDVITNLRIA